MILGSPLRLQSLAVVAAFHNGGVKKSNKDLVLQKDAGSRAAAN
jgi:hypothetical protein